MQEQLFIRISSDEKSLQWGILSASEGRSDTFSERGDLLLEDAETLAEVLAEREASEHKIVLMLPAHRVKCFNVEPPTKNRKHLEKAIPYQLEEQILESVDSQHFALGAFDPQGRLAVNVVSKEYLADTLTLLKDADIEPDFVVSEAACLPFYEDAWSALADEQVLVRQENNLFWSAEPDLVAQLLQMDLQSDELTVSQAIRIFAVEPEKVSFDAVPGLATQKDSIDDAFYFLASNFKANGPNLLQQEFASQKKTQRNYGVWKLPAIAATILVVLGLVYLISHVVHLNHQLSDLEERTLAETQKLYPSLPLSTAMVQINNNFRNIGGDAGSGVNFTGLIDKSVKAMDIQNIDFSQMEYLASRGQLSMDVTAESYEVLTQSQRRLESSGLKVDMRNASENGGVWTARVTVGLNK